MIKVEVHPCGRITYVDNLGGVKIRTDTEPLEAEPAVQALLGGTTLYRVTFLGGRPANYSSATPAVMGALRTEPGSRPVVVREHRCTAAEATNTPPRVSQATATPPRPSAGRTETRSGERQTASSSAPTAETLASSPTCDDCGLPVGEPGTYWGIQIGDLWLYAQHVTNCT